MHYKYADLLINWVLVILKAIYWFNPIVWIVFKQIRKDCELACDERVIESKNKDENSKLKDTNLNLDESLNNSDSAERLNNTPSNSDVNLNDISTNVKNYILNGQGNKAEAEKLKWSNTFLEQVDFKTMYDNYLAGGGLANDVEDFAKYITLSSPIQSNWQELFEKDLYNIYGQSVTKIEHLGGDSYQAYINVDGKDVPYVVVSSRTGYFHG